VGGGKKLNKYLKNFAKYRFLLTELVKKGIKLKYRRSYLGIIWTLLEPLLTTIVLTIVFGSLLGRTGHGEPYPVYILTGRLLYSFFSESTKVAMRSIRANAAMIKKVYVPKYLYPLSSVIYTYIIFLLSLIVLAITSVVLGVYPTIHIFEAFIPLIVLFLFSFGISMMLSTIAVFFRDLEYLWNVLLMLIMYCSAIFYYTDKLSYLANRIVQLNPLYCIISNFRCVVLRGGSIFASSAETQMLIYALVFSLICDGIGVLLFYKNQDNFILQI
jgi:ABC-2 type transport system permease protein